MLILKSAGLYGTDMATGESGYNLAAIMLLGKDDVIRDVCPAYLTDALLRKVNVDRYDDREIVQTNLIDSYDKLMEFARKHLPDKFFLEGDVRVSLRNILAREIISNVLMHREFTSPYMAKFVIEQNRMYIENANRATRDGYITPDNLEPNPKNPLIASFFRNIGLADTLGSGTRKLFKYSKYYSGHDPEFKEGDVFRIVVPLDDVYSFDYNLGKPVSVQGNKEENPEIRNNPEQSGTSKLTDQEFIVLKYIRQEGRCTTSDVAALLGVSNRRARTILSFLAKRDVLKKSGNARNTIYIRGEKFPLELD